MSEPRIKPEWTTADREALYAERDALAARVAEVEDGAVHLRFEREQALAAFEDSQAEKAALAARVEEAEDARGAAERARALYAHEWANCATLADEATARVRELEASQALAVKDRNEAEDENVRLDGRVRELEPAEALLAEATNYVVTPVRLSDIKAGDVVWNQVIGRFQTLFDEMLWARRTAWNPSDLFLRLMREEE